LKSTEKSRRIARKSQSSAIPGTSAGVPSIDCSPAADKRLYGARMIDLTRLNGHRMVVNCDLIKFVEASPDTTISLVGGEKLIVLESCDQLIERILIYRAEVLAHAWPDASSALSSISARTALEFAHRDPEDE
jgi:flagellar protein FlbD